MTQNLSLILKLLLYLITKGLNSLGCDYNVTLFSDQERLRQKLFKLTTLFAFTVQGRQEINVDDLNHF